MSANKKGLGGTDNPAEMVAPGPAVINQYFTKQLLYTSERNADGRIPIFDGENIKQMVHYSKILNHPDKPILPGLDYAVIVSHIIVNMWTGTVRDHWLEVKVKSPIKGLEDINLKDLKVNSFSQLMKEDGTDLDTNLTWVFKWHLNIVHMTREYLKGGWLERSKRIKAIEEAKKARKYLNKFGTTNIINNAKPEIAEVD